MVTCHAQKHKHNTNGLDAGKRSKMKLKQKCPKCGGELTLAYRNYRKCIKGGRVYAATYAEPFPTKETALADYKSDPKAFEPYNETAGEYCKEAK